jgi:hypothetical protein
MSPSRKEPDKEIPVDSTVGSPVEPGNDPGLSEEKSEGSVRISESHSPDSHPGPLKVNGVQPRAQALWRT